MEKVFVSYSRADKDFVDGLIREVECAEIDFWSDRADLSGGDDWYTKISKAVRGCTSFLLVLSPDSVRSEKVSQELSLADKHKRRIIPLVYRQCEIPEGMELLLTRLHWIDFTHNREDGMRGLRSTLGKEGAQTPPGTQAGPNLTYTQPNFPTHGPTAAPPLFTMLPGEWDVMVTYPMQPPFRVGLVLAADGSFRAQLIGATAHGQWGVDMMNFLHLRGLLNNGMMLLPYALSLRVLSADGTQLCAVGPQNEQHVWRRIR